MTNLPCNSQEEISQSLISNIEGRKITSLNGKWQIIIDPMEAGRSDWRAYYRNEAPKSNTDFKEYAFTNNKSLKVPGDWNSQSPRLYYYEGLIWYKKDFALQKKPGRRYFIHFGAVNYKAIVYINGIICGKHEGGFTPFNFEITGQLRTGNNFIIVDVENKRSLDAIPAMNFDWWNYGGITRDVNLVEFPETFIENYFIQLKKNSGNEITGWLKLNGSRRSQPIEIQIPQANINIKTTTNVEGYCSFHTIAQLHLWSPENPFLYMIQLKTETDSVKELIGFRTIEVKGQDILLNGNSVFLRGICLHEEIPQEERRAWSEADDLKLLGQARELGCNFIRLSHYPYNENILRLADKMGILVWEEIPLWQNINFSNAAVFENAQNQLSEMIQRDQNRASIIIWSVANETPINDVRNKFLRSLVNEARRQDNTRLISAASNQTNYENRKVMINDPLGEVLDVIGINEYIGWYSPWQSNPEETKWESIYDKPLIMTEFGAEAKSGNHGDAAVAHSWSEEFQEEFFKKQIRMLKNIPFLRGTCPWILADFKSPGRQLPKFQDNWNRKGLLSDKGIKKKAWFVVHQFYKEKIR